MQPRRFPAPHPHQERLISVAELVSKPSQQSEGFRTLPAPWQEHEHDRQARRRVHVLHGGPDKIPAIHPPDEVVHGHAHGHGHGHGLAHGHMHSHVAGVGVGHSGAATTTSGAVPDIKRYAKLLTPFVYKLFCLVSDASTNALCEWSPAGNSFVVHDPVTFSCKVLPTYFKHNQFSSFVRQLNKYSFHKLAPSMFIFGHTHFLRERPDLLLQIGPPRPQERLEKRVGGASLSSLKRDEEYGFEMMASSTDEYERVWDVEAIEQLVRNIVVRETEVLHRELRIADGERSELLQRLGDAERRLDGLEQPVRFGEKRLRTGER